LKFAGSAAVKVSVAGPDPRVRLADRHDEAADAQARSSAQNGGEMNKAEITHRFAFESFRFDPASGELRGPDRSIKLRPQASLALELLLVRQGEVVSRRELREALWPDERVVLFEASIAAVIRELRRALGDDSKAPRFIETVPKRGFRFVMQSTESEPDNVAASDSSLRENRRRGGFLRVPEVMVLALMVLPTGDTGQFRLHLQESPPVTVAVLAFEELSGRPAHGVLADSLPRELVGWLGAVAPERLRVVDRIGAEKAGVGLHDEKPADFVVLGSVRDDRGAAVISAEMLFGADGRFAWGEHYRRKAEDTGLTAREVAARIADRVVSKSLPQWSSGSGVASSNLAAADAFRRGTEALAQLSDEKTLEAVEAFREATELDPAFSAAHARLAEALISWTGPAVTQDRVERARQAARTSIELVPTNAAGHRVLGEIELYYDRDWQAAGIRLERSVARAPSDASGHHSYAAWLSARGRHGDALREIDLATALDPASVAISIDVMLLRYYARDFEGTVSAARRLKQLWPAGQGSHRFIVLSRLATGDTTVAAAEARTVLAGTDSTPAAAHSVSALSDSEALEAYWTASLRAISRHVRKNSGDPAVLALPYVQLGRFDAANSALESALTSGHFSYFLPYLGVSPAFDRMCGHYRFERILRRLRQSALTDERDLPRCAAATANAAGPGESL
jgi:DNA-binding winged helix-turn-helix (wHTH) protein/TolB-like protein